MDILNISMLAVLIAGTSFFVASEFAIVKARSSRIDSLAAEGNKRALAAKTVRSNLDKYLPVCQLGITATALGLGWLGEPTVKRLLEPIFVKFEVPPSFTSVLSVCLAFTIITFLHVVVGELAPKIFATQKAEDITLAVAKPLILFYRLVYPFIWLLNRSVQCIARLFGLNPNTKKEGAHSEEELRMLVSESYRNGEINQSEYRYVNKIFEFDDRLAKEIMVPRTEMVTIEKGQPLRNVMITMSTEKYTRYPVIDGDKDHIVGMINFKDVFTDFFKRSNEEERNAQQYVRPIIQVIESIPIHDLFLKMQKERTHMAILVDEYGGTSGLVTIEDILEEIVGEIQDEFDTDEQPEIQRINDYRTIVEGKVLVTEVNDLFGLSINDNDVDTIGGWILTEYFNIRQGDSVQIDVYTFCVLQMDGRSIKKIEITKQPSSFSPQQPQAVKLVGQMGSSPL